MRECDVAIVGGGPGGSSCARELVRHGVHAVVLDAAAFPRTKLCAGWITPSAVRQLELDPERYPHAFVSFDGIDGEYFGRRGARAFRFPTTQHSIRRIEFDDWLLRRSGAELHQLRVKSIRRDGTGFVLDDQLRCRHLVGAGGTHCPVYRALFRELNPRAKAFQVAALEEEFAYQAEDPRCRLWFGEHGLVGYSWYVPKGGGYLNVGLGGFSSHLPRARLTLQDHFERLAARLEAQGLVRGHAWRPRGHSYFLREPVRVVQTGNAYLVGDAAGLATRDLAEGIGPAIESGIAAARAILAGTPYRVDHTTRYSVFGRSWKAALLDRVLDRRGRLFIDRVYARHWREKEQAALA